MKTNKPYPCNQLIKTPQKYKEAILWRFADGNENIKEQSLVKLGDIDPMTGEAITDVTWFREYNRIVSDEVNSNLKFAHAEMAPGQNEREQKQAEKDKIRKEFEKEYGYTPDNDTVMYLYEEKHPKSWMDSLDCFFRDCNQNDHSERRDLSMRDGTAEAALGLIENDEVNKLREFAAGLNERQKDIYQAMLMEYDGGGLWITNAELAEKWGVSVTVIRKEQERIKKKIRKSVRG